jgi:hypothetical protein
VPETKREGNESTHKAARQQKAKNRKVPQTPIGLAIMLGNDSVEAYYSAQRDP